MIARLLPYAVIVLLLAAGWTFWPRDAAPVGESVALPPAKEVHTVERIIERPRIVYVYPEKTKTDLDLPADVKHDGAKKVTATGKLDAEDRPYTLSSVLDTATGESRVYARPDPLPWLAPGRTGSASVAYGLKNGEPNVRLAAEQELLRVKRLRLGVNSTLDQDGEWFAGASVAYRW